jgi:hypothetical protein
VDSKGDVVANGSVLASGAVLGSVGGIFGGNAKQVFIGDPGCGPGFAGIGFGSLGGCSNYSLTGNGIDAFLNRPSGGAMHFRENNGDEMTIAPGGNVGIGTTAPSSNLEVDAPGDSTGATPQNAITANGGLETASTANLNGTIGGWGVEGDGGDDTGTSGTTQGGAGVRGFGGTALLGGHGVFAGGGSGEPNLSGPSFGGDGIQAIKGLGFGTGGTDGLAGGFTGDVKVNGVFSALGKNFEIDHPLAPANKYLVHSSVESSEMMNIYTGNVLLDANGRGVVQLPDWFQAENADFRYSLTAIGAPAPNLYIAQEVTNNSFEIAGGAPGMKVSWQVTGIRQDAFAKANPLKVEMAKSNRERGFYLQPNLFGQPEEKGVEWARHPALMKQVKAMREKARQQAADKR